MTNSFFVWEGMKIIFEYSSHRSLGYYFFLCQFPCWLVRISSNFSRTRFIRSGVLAVRDRRPSYLFWTMLVSCNRFKVWLTNFRLIPIFSTALTIANAEKLLSKYFLIMSRFPLMTCYKTKNKAKSKCSRSNCRPDFTVNYTIKQKFFTPKLANCETPQKL